MFEQTFPSPLKTKVRHCFNCEWVVVSITQFLCVLQIRGMFLDSSGTYSPKRGHTGNLEIIFPGLFLFKTYVVNLY